MQSEMHRLPLKQCLTAATRKCGGYVRMGIIGRRMFTAERAHPAEQSADVFGRVPIPGVNDLATRRPDLAKEWHPTKMAI